MARKPRFLPVSLARGLKLPEMMVSGESAPRARKAGEECCDLGQSHGPRGGGLLNGRIQDMLNRLFIG